MALGEARARGAGSLASSGQLSPSAGVRSVAAWWGFSALDSVCPLRPALQLLGPRPVGRPHLRAVAPP